MSQDDTYLRDVFAGLAMQTIITDKKLGERLKHDDYIKTVSETSYEYADAMMAARQTTKPTKGKKNEIKN